LNWLPREGIEKASLLVREAAADAGRRVRVISYVRTAVVDEGSKQHIAREAMREQTYAYLRLPAYANAVRRFGYGRELDAISSGGEKAVDTLVDALCVLGDRDEVTAKLKRYVDAGLDSVIVYPVPYGDDPAESALETIRAAI
jgi:alkanesulfonate monooxygenase SsuD/methylene tetrahydromethanopterin reductase-like flavin-dependent oxidoreductase (luciferase family)